MKRREFIAGLGMAIVPAMRSLPARAQQVPVIGVLSSASFESMRELVAAFQQGLAEIGYVEGRNVVAEYRWAENDYDRLPALAADLVRRQVTVIAVLASTPATLAAKAATATIPIVFAIGTDPVRVGITESLARPAGNLTGATIIRSELMAKSLSLMHELIPTASTIAVLINPANAVQSENEMRDAEAAARILGVRVVTLRASRPGDIELAFAQLASKSADALVVDGENFFVTQRDLVVALATRHAIPTMYPDPNFTAIGGLMRYGAYPEEALRIAGTYVGRILKGEKPSDLPVQQVTRFGLTINLKTAKMQGIEVPSSILLRADEVIE
jgi:putative ABC transport system substrate-binding protein